MEEDPMTTYQIEVYYIAEDSEPLKPHMKRLFSTEPIQDAEDATALFIFLCGQLPLQEITLYRKTPPVSVPIERRAAQLKK